MTAPDTNTLQLLLLNISPSYHPLLMESLSAGWRTIDITPVDSIDEFDAVLTTLVWDAVIASSAMGLAAYEHMQQAERDIPLIVLCNEEDEDAAFALIESGISDVLPLSSLKRLSFVLRRELELKALRLAADRLSQAQIEDSLKRSETRFRAVIEGFNDVILIVDSFQLVRYANRALERILGYSTLDVLGKPLRLLLHPDEETLIQQTVAAIFQRVESASTIEHRIRRLDGEWEIVETTWQNNIDPTGQPMVLFHIRQITARKAAEETLRESERRFQRMADTAPAMIWVTDSSGYGTFMSRGWYEFTGRVEPEALGYGWLDVIHVEDRARAEAHFDQALLAQDVFQIDYRLRRFDGEYRWVSDFGHPSFSETGKFIGYIGSVFDIHERKAAEQELRQSELRYRRVIEDQTEFICRYNPNFELTFVNRAYTDAFHMRPDEMIGINLLDQVPTEDRERIERHIKSLSVTNPVATIEYQSVMPDGNRRWVQWTDRVLSDEQGNILEYQGVGRDVTERRQAEKELEALYNATSHLFKADSLLNLAYQIVETVVREFEHADCGLMLVDREQNKITRLARMGQYDIQPDHPLTLDGLGLVPLTVRTGRMVYVTDVSQDDRYIPSEARTKSELVIPLKTAKGVIAVLDLQRTEVDAFSERDQRILMAYAERAAAAIESMQLYERINQYASELEWRVSQRTWQLNEAKERVEAILNNSPDGIILTNIDLHILQTNFAFDGLFQSEMDAFFGQPLTTLIHPDDAALALTMAQAAITEKRGKSVEVRAQRADGTIFYAELSFGYVGIANIEEAGLVCIIHDVSERKRTQQALEESHRFTQRITATTPSIIYIYDVQKRQSIYSNRDFAALLDYGPDWRPQPHDALPGLHPDDRMSLPYHLQRIADSQESEIYQFEYRLQHRTQGWRWFLSRNTIFRRDSAGTVREILGVAIDITERKQTEEALRDSEEKFRLLVQAAPIAIVITDQTGLITLINIQAEILFGYNGIELLGQPVEMLLPDNLRSGHIQHRATYMKAPRMRRMGETLEMFAKRKDGSQFPIEVELSYVDTQAGLLVITFIADVTERKERERQLRYHASLQENVTDAVIATDLSFRIQSWNRAAEHIYGWTQEEALGKHVTELLKTQMPSGLLPDRVENDFLEAGHWSDEVKQHHRDGSLIYILSSVVLFRDDNHRPIGVVAVNHDITNRKKAEEALHQALVQERELVELKSRFLAMSSHEFRTPLATILTLTETLTAYRHKLPDEQIQQRLVKIKEQVGYLKDIMEDVLLLGRMQARRVEFTPVLLDFEALCKSILEEFQSHPATHHQLIYRSQNHLDDIRVDKKLIRQAISNLVSNAIKYSPQGQTVTVTVELQDDQLLLAVQDEGMGIPEADLKHLFEPFHRAVNVGTISGTGLGLVIAKEAVDLHGGTVAVESQIGVGTTIRLMIPVKQGK